MILTYCMILLAVKIFTLFLVKKNEFAIFAIDEAMDLHAVVIDLM